jgi:hypothetical protein
VLPVAVGEARRKKSARPLTKRLKVSASGQYAFSNGKQEVGVHLWLHDISGGTCLKASLYEINVSMNR